MKYSLLLAAVILCFTVSAAACPDVDGLVDINCDGKVQIVCFGDSITRGVADEIGVGYPGRLFGYFPNAEIINLGDPGENTFEGVARSAGTFPFFRPDYVVILEGVNDYFLQNANAGATANNVFRIVQNGLFTGGITLLGNLTAIRRNEQRSWVNAVNQIITPQSQINFFSLGEGIISSDLLHPNGAGYQKMADAVAFVIQTYSEANRPLDSDNDGIYDFKEQQIGSDPNKQDTDGDTLLDGEEVFQFGSSPLLSDTDGDGFSDPKEVNEIGSNPIDPRPGAPVITDLELLGP